MEVLLLLVLFAVGSLMKSASERKQREQAQRELDLQDEAFETESRDDLMEEIRRAMEGMRQQREGRTTAPSGHQQGRLPRPVPDDDSFDEEDESLEVTPTIRSLETVTARPERVVLDYDAEAESVVQRRVEWAEARARAHRPEDHKAFDRRIRAEPVPAPSAVPAARPNLRHLLIWHEILSKPLALRNRDEA
ncbi:MAG: hypothetical protein KF785_02610 [Gemmatimonadales bacterium]|nr:hypothetical protein [Gemmatimonadales bacterium]